MGRVSQQRYGGLPSSFSQTCSIKISLDGQGLWEEKVTSHNGGEGCETTGQKLQIVPKAQIRPFLLQYGHVAGLTGVTVHKMVPGRTQERW